MLEPEWELELESEPELLEKSEEPEEGPELEEPPSQQAEERNTMVGTGSREWKQRADNAGNANPDLEHSSEEGTQASMATGPP